MSDSILVRVTLDSYDALYPSRRQTQVYVQIPEVARASWLLDADLFSGLKLMPWPNVVDAAIEDYRAGHVVSDRDSANAREAIQAWLRDDANRDEMQAAYELDEARRHPVARKLLAENIELKAQRERRRARLVALQNDALNMRGALSPNGEDRKVPFPLGETLTPAVDWLISRVTELEVAAVEGRAALAALCHDLEDPGSNAFGALYLLQQATPGTPMEPGETVPKVYRASHDSIVMGLYTTATEARAHCEAEERRANSSEATFDWIEDEEDGVAELVAETVLGEESTGYVVTPLEVASAYDEEADE
ncbi:hypothetical protein [Streptomyces hirsutus]|uniref:hypothetical protein n=1 Tax=Streptomyces hirsutus TaxID=35620 RepID=UPI003695AE17